MGLEVQHEGKQAMLFVQTVLGIVRIVSLERFH